MTYRFENVDLLHGAVEHGTVLIQVLVHNIVARRAPFANGLHLEFHLCWIRGHSRCSKCALNHSLLCVRTAC